MPARISLPEMQLMKQLQKGRACADLAKQYGVAETTIWRRAKAWGFTFDRCIRPDLDRERIVEQRRSGLKLLALALEHNTTEPTIWAICKKAGL